jgi:Zn-dependent protease
LPPWGRPAWWMEEQIYLGEAATLTIGALSVAFGLAGVGLLNALRSPLGIHSGYLVGAVLGFLLHELAHREAARRQGCRAGFVLTPLGLALTLLSGLLRSIGVGFAILAPGYVAIYCYGGWGYRGSRRHDLIAAAGPAANIALALVAPLLSHVSPFFAVGFREANAWLALFNLLPFHPLDGAKIFRANMPLWLAMLVIAVLLL